MKKILVLLTCLVAVLSISFIFYTNEKKEIEQKEFKKIEKKEESNNQLQNNEENITFEEKKELGTIKKEKQEEKQSRVYIEVEKLMQIPEFPNGCEIVSLTAVLNYYGYNVSRDTMADTYLPKQNFEWKNGKRYGADPYKYYAGNPRSKNAGWYSFAPPIVKANEEYMKTQENKMTAVDITGSEKEEIKQHLIEGKPIVIWTTLDLRKPKLNSHWYIHETGEYMKAYTNLHAVVLHGFDEEKNIAYVMNPLKGHVEYNLDNFFNSYEEMGRHAIVLEKEI